MNDHPRHQVNPDNTSWNTNRQDPESPTPKPKDGKDHSKVVLTLHTPKRQLSKEGKASEAEVIMETFKPGESPKRQRTDFGEEPSAALPSGSDSHSNQGRQLDHSDECLDSDSDVTLIDSSHESDINEQTANNQLTSVKATAARLEDLRYIIDWRIKGRFLYYLTTLPSIQGFDKWLRADNLAGGGWTNKIHSFWQCHPDEETFYRLVNAEDGKIGSCYGLQVRGSDCSDFKNIVFATINPQTGRGGKMEGLPGDILNSDWKMPVARYWRERIYTLEHVIASQYVRRVMGTDGTDSAEPWPTPEQVFAFREHVEEEDSEEDGDSEEDDDE